MAKKYRTQRRTADAAGIGPYAREREGLAPLSGMRGWNVVSGEADIRSWEVKTISGRVLGTVRELLVDPDAGEVVMLDVDLTGTGRHALLPIRLAEIDRTRRVVRADSGDLEEVEAERPAESRIDDDRAVEARSVRYADAGRERVVDSRPIVEETVVRRRDADLDDARP